MYIVRLSSEGFFCRAKLFKKEWSDKLLSNEIVEIENKKFIFYFLAKYWINKKIIDILIKQKQLEIIDG